MARIVYDRKHCEGFFVCAAMDPDDFGRNDAENKADLVQGHRVRPRLWEKDLGEGLAAAEQAAAGCPVDVIRVVGDAGEVVEGPEKLPIEEETDAEATP